MKTKDLFFPQRELQHLCYGSSGVLGIFAHHGEETNLRGGGSLFWEELFV
jgi:hypothetical protein